MRRILLPITALMLIATTSVTADERLERVIADESRPSEERARDPQIQFL